MSPCKFFLVTPSTRGISLALTRHLLRTTQLPVFATYRRGTRDEAKNRIFEPFKAAKEKAVDPQRLEMLRLDLLDEGSIAKAASELQEKLGSGSESTIETAFLTGGVLYPERQPGDLKLDEIMETFQVNVVSHMLLIKHFSKFLHGGDGKWVHFSARVGSISDNGRGGWYSYRASKSALNQVVKTFDLHLKQKKSSAFCVGVHPGTVRTDLSKEFWGSANVDRLFDPEEAAANIVNMVGELDKSSRGRIWDWAGKEVLP